MTNEIKCNYKNIDYFFFSSRRRHTRLVSDWSSDVCSSDLEFALLDYLHEVEHAAGRVERLERALEEAVKSAPPQMRAVIEGLQALRGIAPVCAVPIVAELGQVSRFARARQLTGSSGAVPREDCSGERLRRGAITT